MQGEEKKPERERRDWIIILLVLLLGFCCMFAAGGQAIRFAPRWRLDTNMRSNIDPNVDFLTNRPGILFEPLDPSVLTQPAWLNVFLTPGAVFPTPTPIPSTATTASPTLPSVATQTQNPVNTPITTVSPTNTLPFIVTPTNTSPPVITTPTFTRTPTPSPSADLMITMSDGSTTYIAGGTVTYTIAVYNLTGPSNVPGATVTDNFPAILSGITWTCSGAGGGTCPASGAGNINASVNLPVGSSVTFVVNANISAAATGNLVNTATVTLPGGITDPVPANNTVTDTDTPVFTADLMITKSDGSTTYIAGGTVTYTIAVYNLTGPSNVPGATVTDNFPAILSGITWTCSGAGGGTCPASGAGNINASVNLPVGSSVTFVVNANISAAATGNLVNTATVTLPGGVTDPVPANNSVTDTDTAILNVDLQITKTDGVASYVPGTSVTYTIVVTNTGPATATGATVTDAFPAEISFVAWSCAPAGGATCTANGTGNISDAVNIPPGGSLTYTAIASTSSGAAVNLTNTATVTAPGGYTDTVPGNNSATDTDTVTIFADLQITKTDNSTDYAAGLSKQYIITVTNAGPSDVIGATVTDIFPSNLTNITWTCSGTGGGTCPANGSGDISTSVNLPAGSSVTFSVDAQVVGTPSGTLDNTASVTAPGGVTDSNPANNNAFDSDVLIVSSGTSYGNFGPGQDNNIELLPEGGPFITLTLSSPITVPGSDLILYEQDAGTLPPTIMMDQIIVEVSDGDNWYTVFNWGDGSSDFASGVAIPLGAPNPTNCAGEPDNCVIDASFLVGTPATGITVDLDALSPPIPNGAVIRFIRFRAPAGGDGDGAGFDGFSFVP